MVSLSNMQSVPRSSFTSIGIEDFRREAARGEALYLHVDGATYKLVANGTTPSGRSVAWVESCGDVSRVFIAAMKEAFGQQVSESVANELGLAPSECKSLSSRVVVQALSMAETAASFMDGVHFAEQLVKGKRQGGGE